MASASGESFMVTLAVTSPARICNLRDPVNSPPGREAA
jgi:hypothetical protein